MQKAIKKRSKPEMGWILAAMLTGGGLTSASGQDFPRIANLWGGSPLSTDYDQWARYDLLVMAGGPKEAWRRFRQEVKARNPHILLLDTAPLMNLGPPEQTPWIQDE